MRRLPFLTALVAVLALAVTSAALATNPPFTKVKGGTTTLTLNSAATTALTSAHLTVTPVAPATASGSTFTFPISGGRVNLKNLHGVIINRGGITVSNGTKSATVRHLTVVSGGKTAGVYGAIRRSVRDHCHLAGHKPNRHLVCRTVVRWTPIKLARITGITVSGSSATGQAQLTGAAAKLLNRLSGGSTFKAGQVFGTGTVSPTF
jgi:hypothetical protein